MKGLLSNLGFSDVWLYQGVGNVSNFLRTCETRLKDIAYQNWNTSLRNSREGLLYKEYKLSAKYSSYFNVIKEPKYRYQFVKFITRNHSLACITGGYHKPHPIPVAQRICSFCQVYEDEYHVVMQCSKFIRLRKRYIAERYWKRPSMHNFISLLTCNDEATVQDLATFIYKVLK